jgi:hypothetical protein
VTGRRQLPGLDLVMLRMSDLSRPARRKRAWAAEIRCSASEFLQPAAAALRSMEATLAINPKTPSRRGRFCELQHKTEGRAT